MDKKSPFDREVKLTMDKKSKLDEAMEVFMSAKNTKTLKEQTSLLERELTLCVNTLFFDIIKEFGQFCLKSDSYIADLWSCKKFCTKFFESIGELCESPIGPAHCILECSIESIEKQIIALYECEEKIIGLVDKELNSESFNAILIKNENDLIENKDSYIESVNLYHDLILTYMKKLFNEQIIYLKRKIRQIKDRPKYEPN